MQRRIHWRMALPYLTLLIVVVAIITIAGVNHLRREEARRWQEHFLNLAEIIVTELEPDLITPVEPLRIGYFSTTVSQLLDIEITLMDLAGNLLDSSILSDRLPEDARDLPAVSQALSEGQGSFFNQQVIAAAILITTEEDQLVGILQIQAPSENFKTDLSYIYWLAAGILLVGTIIVIILIFFINDKTREPIEALSIAAQQMSMGNFHNLDFPDATDELSELVDTLKTLARRLGEQIDTLTRERTMLSSVLNQMTDGVLIANAGGRVKLLNPAAERLFNITQSNGLGRSIVEVLRYHQLVELWQVAKGGERQSTMLEVGPQHIFLQAVGIPLESSLPGDTMLLFQDLTQLRRLETVRRDFISNVSHELRTPLASLKALAETLQEGALEDAPAARRFILRMDTEIDSLTQLVNELLELSRIESGKVPLSFHRIKPCDLIRPAHERMALQVERAGLELIFECPPDLPAVFADPDRITQVMINLVHNAIKFTPPGGMITISAYQDGDLIVFFVRDTGVGIDRNDLGRIFERFYKADRARTGGGMGLGLSIARHMIESHGGYIWVESEEGEGSTFNFSLPIA